MDDGGFLNFGDQLLGSLNVILENAAADLLPSRNQNDERLSNLLLHIDQIEQAIRLLHNLAYLQDIPVADSKLLNDVSDAFREVYQELFQSYLSFVHQNNEVIQLDMAAPEEGGNKVVGRPKYEIPKDSLKELRGLGFSWSQIARMFGVSGWTLYRRIGEYDMQQMQRFTDISDDDVDAIVKDYMSRHGNTTGEPYISGYFKSIGICIQRRRVRESINRIDPLHAALRWGVLISRRTYFVPWPNSLWHIDGHHSLIRWKFVIHGCIDGKSRKIMFLQCNTNNRASTVLQLFLESISNHGGYWPSRIRVDYGVENVLICDAITEKHGGGRGSCIAGSSTRNQRIERLWRDVFRCVAATFYYVFYALEQEGLLDVENPIHIFTLHLVYKQRINFSLAEFFGAHNNHRLSTEQNWTPNQIWNSGMLNPSNPLANGQLDDDPENLDAYGEDLQGPIPSFSEDGNIVVVSPDLIPHHEQIAAHVYQSIHPNRVSTQMGIDVYIETLDLVINKLAELSNTE